MHSLGVKAHERLSEFDLVHPKVYEIWDEIVKFLTSDEDDYLDYVYVGYNCPDRPYLPQRAFDCLEAWCELIGVKHHFEIEYSHSEGDENDNWEFGWRLILVKREFPDQDRVGAILNNYGKPPHY
ncbi:hypothetical protein NU768_004363 [Vibrio vulnificus]|nr:hypothetical protein [Vibrio vulnificus]